MGGQGEAAAVVQQAGAMAMGTLSCPTSGASHQKVHGPAVLRGTADLAPKPTTLASPLGLGGLRGEWAQLRWGYTLALLAEVILCRAPSPVELSEGGWVGSVHTLLTGSTPLPPGQVGKKNSSVDAGSTHVALSASRASV